MATSVDHLYEAVKVSVGYRHFTADGSVKHETLCYTSKFDPETVEEVYGTDVLQNLSEHLTEDLLHVREDGSSYCVLFLLTRGPRVVWAGTGGYWSDVDLSVAEIVGERTRP